MSLSHVPCTVSRFFVRMARWLHPKSAVRLPIILLGMILAGGRRTVTSWFRAGGISTDFRQGYNTVNSVGHKVESMALTVVQEVQPLLDPDLFLASIDDSPTIRYGLKVEGAGIHRHPSPGPDGQKHLYGHIWTVLAVLAKHPRWHTIALPLQAQLYVREKDVAAMLPERHHKFRTKLQMAADQLRWLLPWIKSHFKRLWVVVDGGYFKKPFLKPATKDGWVVIGRLRKDASLWCLPPTERLVGQKGGMPTYGKTRLYLKDIVADPDGWEQAECQQYGQIRTKTFKTFLATYKLAGGMIRVVVVKEDNDWFPYASVNHEVSAVEILEAMADRWALEQTNKDVKEVWGAGEQQTRNLESNAACYNLNLWMSTLVESWAWKQSDEALVDRSDSPWDKEPRRPSHNDKRKALQREILEAQVEEALAGQPSKERIRALAQSLIRLIR